MTDKIDDPTQDPTVLASAYLDGEATLDERAAVESSPELLGEVEQLELVRSIVSESSKPAAVSTREAQLAAALDVFDQLSVTPADAAPVAALGPRRARRERRRDDRAPGERSKLLLGTAAGLVILAGVGAVVRGVIVGSDDADDSFDAAATELVEETSPDNAIGPAESEVIAELEGDNTNDEPRNDIDPGEVAQDVTVGVVPSEAPPAQTEAVNENGAVTDDESFQDDSAANTGTIDEAETSRSEDAPPEIDVVELRFPQDLADLAAPAAYTPNQANSEPIELEASFSQCFAEPPAGLGIERLAEPAYVAGELVNVGVNLDAGLAFAFRNDCSVVLEALLPNEDDFLAGQADSSPTTDLP